MDPTLPLPDDQRADPQFLPAIETPDPPEPGFGPKLPDWFTPPDEVDDEDLVTRARREEDDHVKRLSQYREMTAWLNLENVGHFERDAEDIESGEVEVVRLTDLRDEHDAAKIFLAGMDVTIDVQARDPNDKDEAQAIEDFLQYTFDDWKDQHEQEGGAPLVTTLPDWAMRYGMLATYVCLDPDNATTGLYRRAYPGDLVFPVFEGSRGLKSVFITYDADPEMVIGMHDDAKGTVRKKIETIIDDVEDAPHYLMPVIEYYDRWNGALLVHDEVVKRWTHGYGVVPWVITPMGFGADPLDVMPNRAVPHDRVDMRRGLILGSDRSIDLARQYQPFLWRRVMAHAQEEAFAGRAMTLFRRSTGVPPTVLKQGVLSRSDGDPEIDGREQGVTKLNEDDALEPFPQIPVNEVSGPLMALLAQNRQTGMAPGLLLGAQNPASQMSGTALELGRQGGYEKWAPITVGLERHYASVCKLQLYLIKSFGAGLGEGASGVLYAPRRSPQGRSGVGTAHQITADLVDRASIRINVSLNRFNPMSLTQTGNGIAIWRQQRLMSDETALRVGGFTNDPDGELQRIDQDELRQVPEIKQSRTLQLLRQAAQRAIDKGDEQTGWELLLEAHYIASMMQLSYLQKMNMLGGMMMGQGPGDDPSGESGMGGPGQDTSVPTDDGQAPPSDQGPGIPTPNPGPPQPLGQGQSMPMHGIQTGTSGGRPSSGMPQMSGDIGSLTPRG